MIHQYLQLTLARVAGPHPALRAHLESRAGAIAAAGGTLLAQFAPQIGFASNEAALLLRWRAAAGDALGETPLVAVRASEALTPTLRPQTDAPPPPGGIYVHRWFTIDAAALDEFIALSGAAWPDFERQFDARIYGLFTAAESAEDRAQGARRLLLLTRYGDHGVWEQSRDPTTEAMQLFQRRQALTRVTIARSSLLVGGAR